MGMEFEPLVEGSSFNSPLFKPLATILATLVTIHLWQITRRNRKMGEQIPGPPTLPIIGNAHTFLKLNNNGSDDIPKLVKIKILYKKFFFNRNF